MPHFSPDGKWIAVASRNLSEGVQLWQVGTWQPGPAFLRSGQAQGRYWGAVVFDAESRLLLVSGMPSRLFLLETGREVARLVSPDQSVLSPTSFTPDGKRLIGFGIVVRLGLGPAADPRAAGRTRFGLGRFA